MTTVNTDAKFNGLGKFNYTGAQEDRELQFYQANGATSNSLPDAENQFLALKGFTVGSVDDKWTAYLLSLGYTGSKDDMIYRWWGEFPGSNLALDFTKPSYFASTNGLDPRITFSRTSNATLTNSDGVIAYAPHNLLTYSEQFDNAAWGKTEATVSANTATAPNGTSTADKLIPTAVSSSHRADFLPGTLTAGSIYTASVYAKGDGYSGLGVSFSGSNGVAFNLATGAINGIINLNTTAAEVLSANIEAVNDGWFRCSYTIKINNTQSFSVRHAVNANASAVATQETYTGDGTSGLFIWGAQLNVGALQPYYSTTVKNLLGYTQEFDNAAWTKSNSFVQTNLLTFSEQFDDAAWTKIRSTVTANVAVDPQGYMTADKLIENTDNNTHFIRKSPSLVGSTPHTVSVYLKADERTEAIIRLFSSGGWAVSSSITANLLTGSVVVAGSGATGSATDVGNGWYRVAITQSTNATTGTKNVDIFPALDGTDTYQGDGTSGIFIWGAQLVQGSTPGDYQRTEAAAKAVMYPAPDGSLTADKLVENTTTTTHLVQQTLTSVSGTNYTVSLYAKASERNFVLIARDATYTVGVNLTDGVIVGTTGSGASATTTNVGGGWWRISLLFTASATSHNINIYTSTDGVFANRTYTGDGTSGIFLWGAQLSDSASLDPYVYNPVAAPAAAAYYGPRFDYDPVTLAPKGLLIEESRTNFAFPSADFSGASWTKTNIGPIADSVTAPDGSVCGAYGSTDTSNVLKRLRFNYSTTATGTYTWSFYLKAGTEDSCALTLQDNTGSNGAVVSVRLTDGVVTGGPNTFGTATAPVATVQLNANGFYRIVLSVTFSSALTQLQGILQWDVNGATTSTGTLFPWGAQLEAGAFPTSYIPTTTAAATRAADVAVMQGANFSNWYNQAGGTVYAEAFTTILPAGNRGIYTIDNGNFARGFGFRLNSDTVMNAVFRDAVNQIGLPFTRAETMKTAFAYSDTTRSATVNAQTVQTSTTVMNFGDSLNNLKIGAQNLQGGNTPFSGYIRRIAYFPRLLSNTELQGITS